MNHITAYEIFFIIFAVAFALEEYTASQEHGWDSKSYRSCNTRTSKLTASPNTVYLANVCRCSENYERVLKIGVTDVECF